MAEGRVCCGLAGLFLLMLAGCGSHPTAQRIRDLCVADKADSAYILAQYSLTDQPRNMDVWREFARAALERSRDLAIEEPDQSVEFLVQGALVCAAVNTRREGKLDEAWERITRQAMQEVWKQLNTVIVTCSKQSGAALFLKQQRDRPTVQGMMGDPVSRALTRFEDLRLESRHWIELAAVMRQFARTLPEADSDAAEALFSQLDDALSAWALELELDSRATGPLREQAEVRIKRALEKAVGDLQELGYFIPGTILENGVFS